ncbi:hypothetical protein NKH49_06360 [Mesorhizobium sp. M1088]|uniref:hypothetical protein n=1 Tax=Mesorhizobium sp. M1088 TaxID=2957056 RepID=UPI00333ACC6D
MLHPTTRQRENMLLGSAARCLTSFLRSRCLIQLVVNLESLYGELWVSQWGRAGLYQQHLDHDLALDKLGIVPNPNGT